MKNVVKYCVYEDILLRVSIYVTQCQLFKENQKMDPSVIRLREQSELCHGCVDSRSFVIYWTPFAFLILQCMQQGYASRLLSITMRDI